MSFLKTIRWWSTPGKRTPSVPYSLQLIYKSNSPEHGPTTFGCTHYQQLLHQVFVTVLQASPHVPDPDVDFINSVRAALGRLDKGLHIGTWGEIKEWKLPDSLGYDFEDDTHRHLSNLIGWYPGFSIVSYENGLYNETIKNAIATTLQSRGMGSGPDADAGWEKVWRGACWARLGNAQMAYNELKFAISENFADNGFSELMAVEECPRMKA